MTSSEWRRRSVCDSPHVTAATAKPAPRPPCPPKPASRLPCPPKPLDPPYLTCIDRLMD